MTDENAMSDLKSRLIERGLNPYGPTMTGRRGRCQVFRVCPLIPFSLIGQVLRGNEATGYPAPAN